jgi:GNAT superfamily N-acetyltransferase
LTDDGLRIVSAASVSLEAYAAAFTNAFSGYRFPIVFDAPRLARHMMLEQHDLASSLVVFDGAEAVAVAALAARGERGWVPGFAVVPRLRGHGLGRRLMSALVERARAAGLRRLTLEVLSDNAAARGLYEGAGLRVTREMLVLERPADWVPARVRAPAEAPAGELLTHFNRLHRHRPSWQRELTSLLASNLHGFYAGARRRPRAYALLKNGRDGNTYAMCLAATDAAPAEEVCAALGWTAGGMRIVNEPEESPFAAPLLAHGFSEIARQYEMTAEL